MRQISRFVLLLLLLLLLMPWVFSLVCAMLCLCLCASENRPLANSLPQFSVDDKRAVNIWERSVEIVEGHYQLDIPFKSKLPNLPDNQSVAEKRLQSLAQQFWKDPKLHAKYKSGIQELLDKGYAEKVLDEEIGASLDRLGTFLTTMLSMKKKTRELTNCI